MTRSFLWLGIVACGLGCGDSASSGGNGGDGSGGGDGGSGGSVNICPEGQVCLDVERSGEAEGRFAVIWFRFDGPNLADPTIAYHAPLANTDSEIAFELSALSPAPDVVRFCTRDCEVPADCPCTGDFQAAVAYLMVVGDENNDGSVDASEVKEGNLFGIANTALVQSPASFPIVPAEFAGSFPQGVEEGTFAYRITEGGAFVPTEATRFTLKAGAPL